jgi:hypothetical protein
MKIFFANGWSIADKRVREIWSVEQAEAAHASRQKYTVIAGDISKPFAFIRFYGKGAGVSFLDDLLRVCVVYSFDELEPERLFLTMATTRKFDGATDKVVSGDNYMFRPGEPVVIWEDDVVRRTRKESKRIADSALNWEKYPAFGQYDSLLRFNRDIARPPSETNCSSAPNNSGNVV